MSGTDLRWSHVALNCRDPRVTEAFYHDHFGFNRARVVPVDGGTIVFLRKGDSYLELFAADPAPGPDPDPDPDERGGPDGSHRPGRIRHIALQTDDLDAVLAAMGPAARVSLGPLDFDAVIPGWRSVWLLDPDGVVVEVSQGYRDTGSMPPAVAAGSMPPAFAAGSMPPAFAAAPDDPSPTRRQEPDDD